MATNRERSMAPSKAPSKGPETQAEPKDKAKTEVVVKESKVEKVEQKKPAPSVDPFEPKIPFHRWFKARGFKPRWEAGMRAFTNTAQRRTLAEWDATFKSY